MKKIKRFTVHPNIPKSLSPLIDIAYNLWWTWNPDAIELFRWVNFDKWEFHEHNPIKMLGDTTPERFVELEKDESFQRHLKKVAEDLKTYMNHKTWFDKNHKKKFKGQIAYFSFEYGLHESLKLYSGGLGVLSGDHLKSASDLGIPLVGVGLIYRYGYFQQYLNIDGWQQEKFVDNDFENLPMTLMRNDDGIPLTVAVEMPGRVVYAQIWKIQVGRVSLYMLDANLEINSPADREITYKLYGGDNDTRIQQEILLGIGGIRALQMLGIDAEIYHMNEGHSAFLVFERTRILMQRYNLSFEEARDIVSAGSVFTTHTPVPAGIDLFSPDMIKKYFADYSKELGISIHDLINFGKKNPDDSAELFSMPILAFNFSDRSNGVSKLHGEVSRNMWKYLWPDLPDSLIPLRHITNGIHISTWLSDEMARLYDRHMGPQLLDNPLDTTLWEKVDRIPDMELWRSKERLRERLVVFARDKIKDQMKRRGSAVQKIMNVDEILDPEALTIGFSRRFATYKRATLIFRDLDRLDKILNDRDRPVQIIFAGKSHPKDNNGKEFIRQIVHIANSERFRRRVVFLEDYNMHIARYLVQGVDVWLNNPRRPLEASGTSGMKVPPNGGINVSVLDGWWDEGYDGTNGWAIGSGEVYGDHEYQDEVETLALYEILEEEVIPAFYNRKLDGLPRDWIRLMKNSMRTVSPVFNTNRMVSEYFDEIYQPGYSQLTELLQDKMKIVRDLSTWKDYIRKNWQHVGIEAVYSERNEDITVGMEMEVNAVVNLGNIDPDDVRVALFHGALDASGELTAGQRIKMKPTGEKEHGKCNYVGYIPCPTSGQQGYSVCVYPDAKKLSRRFEKGYIRWWEGNPEFV